MYLLMGKPVLEAILNFPYFLCCLQAQIIQDESSYLLVRLYLGNNYRV